MSMRQISLCMPEWQAVTCDASLMKWCSSDLCSGDSEEKGSTGLASDGLEGVSEDSVV